MSVPLDPTNTVGNAAPVSHPHVYIKGCVAGVSYELKESAKSAFDPKGGGKHLVLVLADQSLTADPSLDVQKQLIEDVLNKIRAARYEDSADPALVALGKQIKAYGLQLAANYGEMRKRGTFHIHIMIPGSKEEVALAPQLYGTGGSGLKERYFGTRKFSDIWSGMFGEPVTSAFPAEAVRHYVLTLKETKDCGQAMIRRDFALIANAFLAPLEDGVIPEEEKTRGVRLVMRLGELAKVEGDEKKGMHVLLPRTDDAKDQYLPPFATPWKK